LALSQDNGFAPITQQVALVLVEYFSFLLKINGSCPLIPEKYVEYMLRYMGTKDGTVLYHIGYGG
jgi:hypothetical protein